MGNSIKGITIEIGGSTQKLDQALKGNEKTAKSLQNELKAVNAALKLDPTNIEAAKKKQELLTAAVENTKEKLNTLKEAQEKAKEAFDKGEMSAEQYRAIETEVINTENELKRLENELKNVHGAADAVGAKFEEIGGKVSGIGDKITGAGKALAPVSAAAAGLGAAAVASLMEMDEGYDTVITKTGATGEALKDLTEQADDVFSSLPTSAKDAGIAVGEVNTRFKITGDACEELSKDFIRFAEINNTDLNTSIDSVDAIMTKFGVDSKNTTAVLGLMTKKGQDTGLSMEILENALNTNGATLKEMGLDLIGSVNLLAQFEESGVDTATALTGLKKAQQNATAEGKSLDEALKETIEGIKNASSETEALQIATDLFGKKGAAEMTQAIREGRFSLEDLTGSLSDYRSVVEDTFNATLDPWDEAKTAVNDLKVAGADLAGELMETAQPIISGLTAKVKVFTTWLKNLDAGTKQMIIKIGAIIAVLSPALMLIGKLTSGVGGLISMVGGVISKLGGLNGAIAALASPVGIVVAAIAALVAAFIYFYKTNDEFREKVNNAVEQIKAAFQSMSEKIKPLLENLKAAFNNLMTALQPVFQFIITQVMTVINGIINAMPYIISAVTNVIDYITNIVNAFIALLNGDFDGFFAYAKAAWQNALDFIKNILTAFSVYLQTVFSAIWQTIVRIFKGVGQWFSDRFNEAYTGIRNIFAPIGQWFGARWTEIKNVFSTVTSFFQEKFNTAAAAIKNAFSTIPQFFSDLWQKITAIFIDAGQKVANGVMGAFKSACNAVFGTIEGIVNGFVNAINSVLGLINEIPGVDIDKLSKVSLPRLAKGGVLSRGQAIVGEAGAELLTMTGGKAIVTPLSDKNRNDTLSAAGAKTGGGFIQNIKIESPKPLSPYEVARQTRNQTRNMVLRLQGAR